MLVCREVARKAGCEDFFVDFFKWKKKRKRKNLCPIRGVYVSLTGGETLRSRGHGHAPLSVAVERCNYDPSSFQTL